MKVLRKAWLFIYNLYAIAWFLILMIPVFLFSLAVSLFGNIRGGNLIYKACRTWGKVWFALIFFRHKNIYEQHPRAGESYIYVANHISYLDAAIIVRTFERPLRPLAKIEMSKIPLFGFIYRKAVVVVDRSSAGNRVKSVQMLKAILRKGISVLVFPEGTFNITHKPLKEFYDGAFRIAIETGTPIKPVLFLDGYERMPYDSLLSLNPGRIRVVHLEEIATEGLNASDLSSLRDQVYSIMETKLNAYKASWIRETSL